jgi:hypothetical protein
LKCKLLTQSAATNAEKLRRRRTSTVEKTVPGARTVAAAVIQAEETKFVGGKSFVRMDFLKLTTSAC